MMIFISKHATVASLAGNGLATKQTCFKVLPYGGFQHKAILFISSMKKATRYFPTPLPLLHASTPPLFILSFFIDLLRIFPNFDECYIPYSIVRYKLPQKVLYSSSEVLMYHIQYDSNLNNNRGDND